MQAGWRVQGLPALKPPLLPVQRVWGEMWRGVRELSHREELDFSDRGVWDTALLVV